MKNDDSEPTPETLIQQFIDSKIPWAVIPFNNNSKGLEVGLFKGQPKSILKSVVEATKAQASRPITAVDPRFQEAITSFANLYAKFGKELPVVHIGPYEGHVKTTIVYLTYQCRHIRLDYAEPDFFDQLERVLLHIQQFDSFGGLFVKESPPPWADHHSGA